MALLRPIRVVDEIIPESNSIKRKLLFVNQSGIISQEAYFSDDRVTLFHNGKLYDWYGREVKLDDDISRIVRFYSGVESYNGFRASEEFIVEKKDNRVAIAALKYQCPKCDSGIPVRHKDDLTGRMLGRIPILECEKYDFARIDTKIVDTPVFQAFLENSDKKDRPFLTFYDIQEKGIKRGDVGIITPGYEFLTINFTSLNREEVLKMSPGAGTHLCSGYAYCSGCFLNGVTVSEDGQKMTGFYQTWSDPSPVRVSTDVDFLKHLRDKRFWWYQDPL